MENYFVKILFMGRLFNMRCYVEMQLFLFCVGVEAEKLNGHIKVFFFCMDNSSVE